MHNLDEWIIFDTLPLQFCMSNFGNRPGVFHQAIWVNAPINFDLAGEMGHRIRFNACTRYTQFLTLYQYRSGTTKRVQHALFVCDPKALKIGTNKMWRKRKHKAIPFVDSTIFWIEFVNFAVHASIASDGVAHNSHTSVIFIAFAILPTTPFVF